MKYGISGQADFVNFSGNPRPEYQCAALNIASLAAGKNDTDWYNIIARTPDRASALQIEREYVEAYIQTHGSRPELQVRHKTQL